MPGGVLLLPGMAGFIEGPQTELAVGPNYEQFDGLDATPEVGPEASTYYGDPVQSREGPSNRGTPTPLDEQTYTPSPNNGLVNTYAAWARSSGVVLILTAMQPEAAESPRPRRVVANAA